jgi:NAD(P)-dependent dehydrogenase (short-subunit alcohol dehydrogenase family)
MQKYSKSQRGSRSVDISSTFYVSFQRQNLKIFFPCRLLIDEIRNEIKNSDIVVHKLDLASFKSIRGFAKTIIETEPQIDIFVHNAAVALHFEKLVTEDGLDMTMGSVSEDILCT